jgi:acetyl esterase/lipase
MDTAIPSGRLFPDISPLREDSAGAADRSGIPRRDIPFGDLPRQKLDLYLPDSAQVKATIVFFYGGGWVSGARWYYRLFGRVLASRGYAVVIPDYHLYPGARFPVFNEDAALALKWVHANMGRWSGRVPRLFLMGHSAGAHISATLALEPRYLRSHGLEPDIIRGVIGLAGPYTFNPLKWAGYRDVFASASETPDQARPIKLVRPGAPPMLLLHGDRDRVAGSHASQFLAEALTAAGSRADARIYPGIGHFGIFASYMPGLRWRASTLRDTEAFIASA